MPHSGSRWTGVELQTPLCSTHPRMGIQESHERHTSKDIETSWELSKAPGAFFAIKTNPPFILSSACLAWTPSQIFNVNVIKLTHLTLKAPPSRILDTQSNDESVARTGTRCHNTARADSPVHVQATFTFQSPFSQPPVINQLEPTYPASQVPSLQIPSQCPAYFTSPGPWHCHPPNPSL